MRVIKTKGSDQLDWVPRLCGLRKGQAYAILSHRWLEDGNNEVLFVDIKVIDERAQEGSSRVKIPVHNPRYSGTEPKSKQGYEKLRNAAKQALKDGYEYLWADMVCIDKDSSAELSEAINSMYEWYAGAQVCYAYLKDVSGTKNECTQIAVLGESDWWRRIWTLQELLAPKKVVFFKSDWVQLGDKHELGKIINMITRIDVNFLNGARPCSDASIAQRMSWASERRATREEDMAYSLLGLFDVNLSLIYGEGLEKAFLRLQEEIMKISSDESLFAWKDTVTNDQFLSGLLASSPAAFEHSGSVLAIDRRDDHGNHGLKLDNQGLKIWLALYSDSDVSQTAREEVAMKSGKEKKDSCKIWHVPLRCFEAGSENARPVIRLKDLNGRQYARVHSDQGSNVLCRRPKKDREYGYKNRKKICVKQRHNLNYSNTANAEDNADGPTEASVSDHIKLFRIVPDKDKQQVRLRVFEASAAHAQYTLLLHLRQGSTEKTDIEIDDKPKSVDQNINDLLKEARRICPDQLLWIDDIDDICRKQINPPEQPCPTPPIDTIYKYADKTFFWLDADEKQSLTSTHADMLRTFSKTLKTQEWAFMRDEETFVNRKIGLLSRKSKEQYMTVAELLS